MTIVGLKILRELKGEQCFFIDSSPKNKKSICTSRTFPTDISDINLIKEAISNHAMRCSEKLRKQKSSAKYIGVFLNTNPFNKQDSYCNSYKSALLENYTNDSIEIIKTSDKLLKSIYRKGYSYKKSGVIIGDIIPDDQIQLNLFNNLKNHPQRKDLFKRIDFINKKMGRNTVRVLSQGISDSWSLRQQNLSPCYTTRWDELLKVNC
jgi:DNA polymerase V